jgi:hypothetical protein
MRNVAVLLNKLVSPKKQRFTLSKVIVKINENRWLVEATITGVQQIVIGSAALQEYILHENTKILTNLGTMDIVIATV